MSDGAVRGVVRAEPDRLEAYAERTLRAVAQMEDGCAAYRDRVAEYHAAGPNDLGLTVTDRAGSIQEMLHGLRGFDAPLAAFGWALRHLDHLDARFPLESSWYGWHATEKDMFTALVAARLEHPGGSTAQVLDAAEEGLADGLSYPWDDGVLPWLAEGPTSATWWTGTAIGLGTGAVNSIAAPTQQRGLTVPVRGHWNRGNWIDPHHRWRPGWAGTMGRLAPADTVARWGPRVGRVGGVAGFAFAGGGQLIEDWNDPTLSAGDRIARAGTATVVEGGAGFVGGVAGAAIGQALIPIPVVGAVIGGAVGGWIGGEVGKWANDNFLGGATEDLGEGIDSVIEDAQDVGGEIVEFGGDVIDDIGGWF